MSHETRLNKLERTMPRGSGDDLCLRCAGPGGFRRMIELARSGADSAIEEQCRQCGGLTFYAAMEAQHLRVEQYFAARANGRDVNWMA